MYSGTKMEEFLLAKKKKKKIVTTHWFFQFLLEVPPSYFLLAFSVLCFYQQFLEFDIY